LASLRAATVYAASSVGIVWGVLAVLAAAVLMVFLFRGTADIKQRQRTGM
jgi:amino acid permease